MGGPVDATELTAIDDLLRRQWLRLRGWVAELEPRTLARDSAVPGWTVGLLVAHLGRGFEALAVVQPTAAGTAAQSLGEYVAAYRDGAAEIDRLTRELAERIADDPLRGLDRVAETGLAQVTQLRETAPDPVVRGLRGPIHLSDMLVSRLLELVVHGDDLVRSLDRPVRSDDGPLDPDAVRIVAEALLEVVVDRGGWDLEVVDPLGWVRIAAGRVPLDTDALTSAIRARHTSDSVPDLGGMLPLL
ncbi:maleylpyruvate isomerase N-terminal domain-containing protein [Actinotalea ferrariae]|uniref:maleylpyruvate isomerase N-terminal domain-containing protein n=1 Tax=Actinotalea ferrariae TaxID=1386098 RepID=UPI001C8C0676|nr:maleylpyruvate isomerase N-terminal domain-containing protein [Actinotalea ferrariae]MBX9245701.1 maleylpyruvate isomerase N-terminal domain-containing protein [Actinotalea ferrariae]